MKKEYVKPYLALESFQLVAALAGSCQHAINHSVYDCANGDVTAFFGSHCDLDIYKIDGGITDDGLCYQVAVEGITYLTS